eukprot:6475342-Amphidinium_carterae.1
MGFRNQRALCTTRHTSKNNKEEHVHARRDKRQQCCQISPKSYTFPYLFGRICCLPCAGLAINDTS